MGKKKAKEVDGPPKDEFDPVELVTKQPQTVVLMLQSQEETVLQTVCDVLYKYAEKAEENKSHLLSLGALEHLISLLSHEDKLVKRNAVKCMGSIATDPSVRRYTRKHDICVPSLLALLSSEEELVCHEFATQALSSLSEDYTSKLEILEKGGLQLLISMLSSPDCDVQRSATKAISLLLDDFKCRAVYNELNGVEPLLRLMLSEFPVIQEFALEALIKCTQEEGCRVSVREFEGLSKLVDIIGDQSMDDLHVLSLQVLANCLIDTECLRSIQTTGIFEKLLAFVAESSIPDVQIHAANVIAAAAKSDENRRIFHEQETEKTLITLLGQDNIEVSTAAVKALASLAENLSSRDKIGRLDGIQPIIALLKQENGHTHEMVCLALANLTTSNTPNCEVVMEKHAGDLVIKMLSSESPSVQSNAAVCLANLALNETWREEIIGLGVVKGLVAALQSNDTDVQVKCCQTLSAVLCDQVAKTQLFAEEGLEILVRLVKSNHEAVRRTASWVIVMCAADQDLAGELTRIGGLDALQEINSSSRRSAFTQTAMERILDSSLPAKYALTGVLKYDNIIENGFYDTGRVSPDCKFLTLQDLVGQPVDQKRPIIIIYEVKEPQREEPTEMKSNSPELTKSGHRSRAKPDSRKMSRSRQKLEMEKSVHAVEEKKEEVEAAHTAVMATLNLTNDVHFASYVDDVKRDILPVMSIELQVRALASYVSDAMGGAVEKSELPSFSYELHISELKKELDSNVIPIGKIRKGIYYHRALLYKALADQLSIPCSLVRGDYGRAWNEVRLCDTTHDGQPILPPKTYLVDVMHSPGDLYLSGTPDAANYQRI